MKLSSCNCCPHKMGAPDGFALIEVVVSLFLVYLIVGLLLNVVTAGMAGLSSSQRQTIAWAYGSSLLEEMKAHPERFVIPGGTSTFNSRDAVFGTVPPEGMTAELEVQPMSNVPGVYRVTVHIFADQGESPWEEYLLGFIRMSPELL
ncbi:MAG: hypothetical protein GX176_11700 [Syntrophomonadaceae bacterium]|nr:hypothetical protein [Syntrophomonadaceae bacterium]HQA51216.1 hypothetical protein [Syntrophomonadaceae bacterium]